MLISEFLTLFTIILVVCPGIFKDVLHISYEEDHIQRQQYDKQNSTFLPKYRSPCWYDQAGDNKTTHLKCLPYFYLIGAPKCGTTDLQSRMIAHPLISEKVVKEPHWINRQRYRFGNELSNYLQLFNKAVQEDIVDIEQNGYHPIIFGQYVPNSILIYYNFSLFLQCTVQDS
ncbi:carbohydrate sulfotransferase 15-like [Mercenaria mercenaria]|uniref:carbohydrate sulfotransferase 15-like n=1 Tax=Mercenaria mercenaria TaxID=6596 RepID=UPI00234EF20B|nr:carbohydrate sulfotransferase 15-like [Mercenaria mercenaria]